MNMMRRIGFTPANSGGNALTLCAGDSADAWKPNNAERSEVESFWTELHKTSRGFEKRQLIYAVLHVIFDKLIDIYWVKAPKRRWLTTFFLRLHKGTLTDRWTEWVFHIDSL